MNQTYLEDTYSTKVLPKEDKERHVWFFSDIHKMNNFWSQLLLVMASQSQSNIALSYCPHTWFDSEYEHQESQYKNAYLSKVKQFSIIASTSNLDKEIVIKRRETNNEEIYIPPKKDYFSSNPDTYLDIVDDFIITIKLDKKTTALIENFYNETTCLEQNNKPIQNIFKNHHPRIKIILEKNKSKTDRYRKKFKKIFGLFN